MLNYKCKKKIIYFCHNAARQFILNKNFTLTFMIVIKFNISIEFEISYWRVSVYNIYDKIENWNFYNSNVSQTRQINSQESQFQEHCNHKSSREKIVQCLSRINI